MTITYAHIGAARCDGSRIHIKLPANYPRKLHETGAIHQRSRHPIDRRHLGDGADFALEQVAPNVGHKRGARPEFLAANETVVGRVQGRCGGGHCWYLKLLTGYCA